MENKIIRFFILSGIGLTVTDSQVFSWMDLLKKKGFPTSIINIAGKIAQSTSIDRINEKTGGNYYHYNNNVPFFSDFFYFAKFLILYYSSKNKAQKVIFQTRTSGPTIPLMAIKIFTKARIIYDARGATIEESIHVNQNKKRGLKKKYKFNLLKMKERMLIKHSHHVFCVSNTLKSYYLDKYHVRDEKFTVVPCAADDTDFYFDAEERQAMRKKFGITDKKVILYSGRLYRPWDIPEEIFNLFSDLNKVSDEYVLFLLTPDHEIANKFILKFKLNKENVIVTVDSFKNVRKYLNMVDYGLLLREDAIMNHVSSPTKFAEYLLCGLPIIMSDTVKDYAGMIRNSGNGLIVENFQLGKDSKKMMVKLGNLDRKDISTWAQKHLSKECYIDSIISVFQNI